MKHAFIRGVIASTSLVFSCTLFADGHAPQAYIVTPTDGATVPSTFKVVFGLRGMGVAPAGVEREKTGHHHLLVDMEQLPPLDQPLGKEVKHFGGGQTETTLTLPPGQHTLQLILGDHQHKPHEPPLVSERITIEVK
ncbi:DUF4399 domain-containing protein [Pontibacterium granulatum]|uniref:DUF4399 domain-containing protein n=1 Tax=Pontibacterium granulatum TaxID=2036029 RepID=UPI00249AB875|nr:DUF4399 domain-containing protein [Pontibacterium granulatum]MDI3323311.1 DUF4399 domain-containing protein [Pontibacterium granulatum]